MNSTNRHPAVPIELASALLALDDSVEMAQAVLKNVFYVEAIPRQNGTYSIGSRDEKVPALYATEQEVIDEIAQMQSQYAKDIENGERESDDEWEGELMQVRVNPDESDALDFKDGADVINTEKIHLLCGW